MENETKVNETEVSKEEVKEEVKAEEKAVETEAKTEETKAEETKTEETKPAEGKDTKKTAAIVGGAVGGVIVVGIILLIVIIIVVVLLVATAKPKANLNKYVTVEYTGYEGRGTAEVVFDWDQFEADSKGKYRIRKKYQDELSNEYGVSGTGLARVYLRDAIKVSADPGTDLSSGDEVKIVWDVDEDLTKYMRVKFKYKDFEDEANGFEVIGSFDPFDYIDVSFTGTAPNGYVSVSNNYMDDMAYNISFSTAPQNGLSNGDTVTVTASLNMSEDAFADRYGTLPSTLTKEYTVEGLSAYVQSASELSTELIDKINSQAKDAVTAQLKYSDSWYKATIEPTNVSYVGNYFLTPKDGTNNQGNILYMVYKVTYSAVGYKNSYEVDRYVVFQYTNIMDLPEEGVFVNVMDYSMSFDREWDGNEHLYYYGYTSTDQIFDKFVVKNIEKYNYEKNITQ
ncbi:MAG: hypothetical protein II717_03005 [Lachnospiraceae bacterium]|nr:hypothetical protein [Lachnospiraceae bacterium]